MAFIGCGHFKLHYIYIFVLVLFQFLSDYLVGFYEKDYINKPDEESFVKFGSIFSYHPLFQNFMYFFGAIICGLIFYIIYLKTEKEKEGMLSIDEIDDLRDKMLGLNSCYGYLDLILTCVIYILNILLRSFLTSMKFDAGFWTLEILFIIYLSVKILKVKIGNHQKVTIIILAIFSFLLQIVNSFLPRSVHDDYKENEQFFHKPLNDYNLYNYIIEKFGNWGYIILILLCYTIHFMMRDYSWVKFKYFLDIKSKPIFKVLLYIGIIGCCFVAICLIIATKFPCKIIENITKEGNKYLYYNSTMEVDFEKEICYLIEYDDSANKLTFFYDNFFIFFKDYKNSNRIILEIFIIPIYFVINIAIIFCNAMILKHVDPNAMLVNINFNYFISRMVTYIINNGSKEYLTLEKFILLELCEFLAILAYMIYIELIELKFCNLDYHLKTRIEERSIEDASLFSSEKDDESEDLNAKAKANNEDEESQNDNISSNSTKNNQ